MSAATVFIVDDDASVRRAMARLFAAEGYFVALFASATEFLESNWEHHGAGCIVLDINMPGPSGLQLQEMLSDKKSLLPIIFLSGHGDIPITVTAMKAGAVDFLPKPARQADLLKAVSSAIERHRTAVEHQREVSAVQERIGSLTPREREVMDLVVQGLLNKQIADQLEAAEKTIKVHRGRVMRKMEVQSVADLVRDVGKAAGGS